MWGVLGWSLVSQAEEWCDGKDSDGIPDNEPVAQIGYAIYHDAFQAIDAAEAGDIVHVCRGSVWSSTPAAIVRSGVRVVGHGASGRNPILVGTLEVEADASVELESLTLSHTDETLIVGARAKVTAVDTRFEAHDTPNNILLRSETTFDLTRGAITGGGEGISGGWSNWDPLPASQAHVILEDSVLHADSIGIRAGDDSLIEGGLYRAGAAAAIRVQDTEGASSAGATILGARVESFGSAKAILATTPVLIESSEIIGDIAAPGLYTHTTVVTGDVKLVTDAPVWWIATLTTVFGTVHLIDGTVEGVNDTLLVHGLSQPGRGGLIVGFPWRGVDATVRGMRVIGAGTEEGPAIVVNQGSSLVFEGGEIRRNHVTMYDIEFYPAVNTTAIAVGPGADVELRDTFVTDNDSPAVVLEEDSTLSSVCTWWGEGEADNDFDGYYEPVDIVAGGQSWLFDFSDVWCDDSGCVSTTPTCFSDPKATDSGL